jgi:hypothetical protein
MNWVERGIGIAVLVQLVTFALHDTVPLGRWNNLGRFKREIPLGRRVRGSLQNSVTALAVVGVFYMGWMRGGESAGDWRMALLITAGVLLYMEFRAWWRPYLFGSTPEEVAKLLPNWEGTYAFLPVRNGVRPNAMHVLMHASTLAMFVLAVVDHSVRMAGMR